MRGILRLVLTGLLAMSWAAAGVPDAVPSGMKSLPEEAVVPSEGSGGTGISSEWLQRLLREEVIRASGWDLDLLEVQAINPLLDIRVDERPVSYQVQPPSRVSPGHRVGIKVLLYGRNGRVIRRVWVSGKVDLYQSVWVINVAVRRGELLKPGDISRQRRHVREVPSEALEDPHEVLGMQARRTLVAGTILQRDQWKTVPLVQRGQRVRILLETAFMRLVAPGETLEEGGHGDRVRVVNLASRQVVQALVRDPQTVQVMF
jgi:flagella basal body P-ring formation protein FlgA